MWWSWSIQELVGAEIQCPACGNQRLRKETDILDVWLDSGVSHLAVLNQQEGLRWPADVYLEGVDQYRGWFQSSLIVGVALRGEAPYRECVSHGWTLDEQGRAMSKSLGNIIEPQAVVSKHGADILRLWVASVEFTEDVRLSETILNRLSEGYRKIRNTFRFALGNLHDFDLKEHVVPPEQMHELDLWMLARTAELVKQCRQWYDQYAFHRVFHALHQFAATQLSALYFDVLKDRLYTWPANSVGRRSAQTAIYRITYALVRLFAPILSFTTEEVWQHLQLPSEAPESVHLAYFPTVEELTSGMNETLQQRLRDWDRLLEVRDDVLRGLEVARQQDVIGASLEARVILKAGEPWYGLLEKHLRDLPEFFIVSQVSVEPNDSGLVVLVERASGKRCERCWKYSEKVGSSEDFPTLCPACIEAVSELVRA